MADSSQTVISITELGQVGAVVRDLNKIIESIWNTFGIGSWDIVPLDADSMIDATYYGKPARYSFKCTITYPPQ